MLYQITHWTTYTYNKEVHLEPHILRLRSRSDHYQTLRSFNLEITPQPLGISTILDLPDNVVDKVWFDRPTNQLTVKVTSQVATHCENPFNYLLEPWAISLPIDYPAAILNQLQPYLQPLGKPGYINSDIANLAEEICLATNNQTALFPSELNQRLYQNCSYFIRETGEPLPPGITWQQKSGSCRDLTMVFIEACRAVGLAARFVSGYQEGDPDQKERHLHAWAEVYLPGAGWRGFDPTHGLAVADRHVALVASILPLHATPIAGAIKGVNAQSQMNYGIEMGTRASPFTQTQSQSQSFVS